MKTFYFGILLVIILLSCVQKEVIIEDINLKNNTATLRKFIRDKNMNWIYLEFERNVSLSIIDSVKKYREKQLDTILLKYREINNKN